MRKKVHLSAGYIRRKVAIHGTRKKPITTSLLIKRYNRFIKNLDNVSLQRLINEHENYNIKFMTKIDKRLNMSNKEKRYLIERTMSVYTGNYQELKKTVFISNYDFALEQLEVDQAYRDEIYAILHSKSPKELALIIKSQSIPSAFIFYEGGTSEERTKQLTDDLEQFILGENAPGVGDLKLKDLKS